MAFEKGQSGNPGGRPKDKPWRQALMLALKDEDGAKLRRIAEKVVGLAEDGDLAAVKEIADRLDGKAAQTTVIQGDDEGGPLRVQKIERVIVDPANTHGAGVPAAAPAGPV